MRKARRPLKWVLGCALLLVLAWACAQKIALVEPQTAFGVAAFKWRYNAAQNKADWLRRYDQNLIDYNGGYVPEPVDTFLIGRVATSRSDQEINAIAAFYARKGGQRTTDGVVTAGANTKSRFMFGALISSASFDLTHKERALVFIDELRRGETHYKASIHVRAETAKSLTDEQVIGIARKAFFEWWSLDVDWKTKCAIDPLADTPLEISGP